MVVRRLSRLRRGGADRDDGVDHVVAGHDVDHRVRRGREVGQLTPAVREDQRLGHLEALDPARVRVLPGRLHDRRPDDGDPDVRAGLDHRRLAQGLGEGVDVGPAQRAGPLGPGLDQLGLDPFQPAALGVGRGGQVARPPVLALGQLAQRGEPLRRTRLGLDLLAHPQAGLGLGPVVGRVLVRTLGNGTAAPTGRVRRGDVYVVRDLGRGPILTTDRVPHPVQQRLGADDIGGEGLVDGRVEETSPAQCTSTSRSAG